MQFFPSKPIPFWWEGTEICNSFKRFSSIPFMYFFFEKILRNHVFEVIWTVLTLQFPKEVTSLEVMDLHERLIPLLTQLIHLGLCAKNF